jgi:hypothetical protein
MPPDDNAAKSRTLADIAYSGLLGLALGLVLALLPVLAISLSILEWRSSYTAMLAGIERLLSNVSTGLTAPRPFWLGSRMSQWSNVG